MPRFISRPPQFGSDLWSQERSSTEAASLGPPDASASDPPAPRAEARSADPLRRPSGSRDEVQRHPERFRNELP